MINSNCIGPTSIGLTRDNVTGSRSAVQTVSEYAQASITLVPKLDDLPTWYAPIQIAVSTAQAQSQTWLTSICPVVSTGLPASIIGFDKAFDAQITKILAVMDESENGVPAAVQKQTVADALNVILAQAQHFADAASAMEKTLGEYTKALMADVDALGGAVSTLEEHLSDGSQYVQKLKQAYSSNFLDVQGRLSPCNVIVMMDMDISIKVTMTGAPSQAIAIVIAQILVGFVEDNVKQTMPALQVVMDSWGTLHTKIEAIVNDLDGVSTNLPDFLKQFDLKTAQSQWAELSNFAQTLIPPADT